MFLLRRITVLIISALAPSLTFAGPEPVTLSRQAESMPADFRTHFFDVPVSARVQLDGKTLGDAIVVLTTDNTVKLVRFTENNGSPYDEVEREKWAAALANPVALGACESGCPGDLMALDYSLASAQLSLVTSRAGAQGANLWHPLPKERSSGLLLSNNLNAIASQQQMGNLNWNGGLEAALGNWTGVSQFQLDHNSQETRHDVTSLYAEREFQQTFLRTGLFTPESRGVLRQPYTNGGLPGTLVGVMTGSSDMLMKQDAYPSLFPVYVTANREGVAEIYRNGSLINSQPVSPGLHLLDTSPLPGGIYEVEIRIIEDGREISRETQTINKPSSWRNPDQRLRYNLFAGKEASLLRKPPAASGGSDVAGGASANWLIHPRLTAGAAVQQVGRERQIGTSLDWTPAEPLALYGNIWHSNVTGRGFDTQGLWRYNSGSVILNHSHSWYLPERWEGYGRRNPVTTHSTSLALNHRFKPQHSVTGRLSQRSSTPGLGVDASYNTYSTIAGTEVSWSLSGFDRPYGKDGGQRNRGVGLSASFALGSKGRSVSASIGSRTDSSGGRDLYASATVDQQWENSWIKSTAGTVTADRFGTGLSGNGRFDTPLTSGSLWGQRSTQKQLSGGINLSSTVAVTGKSAVMSPEAQYTNGGAMIIEMESDDPNASIVALHDGGRTTLRAGKNLVPLNAWKPGSMQFDFPGSEAPALKIIPERVSYHVIRGGVRTQKVSVMKTVTVMGRMVDNTGVPLGGASVINHAGRTLTELDGLFTLELHEKNPVISVEHPSGVQCEVHLDPARQKQQDIIFVGNLPCRDGTTETTTMRDRHS